MKYLQSLLAALLLSISALPAQPAGTLLARADSLLDRNRHEAAGTLYAAVLRQDGGNERALRAMGFISLNHEQPDSAIYWLRKALAVNPACGICYINLARARRLSGDTAGFRAALDSAILVQPKDGAVRASRGAVLAAAGRRSDAEDNFEEALRISPASPVAQALYADFLYGNKYPTLAYEHLGKAIRLASRAEKSDYYRTRAGWQLEARHYRDAIADLDSAIQFRPADPRLLQLRGIARFYGEDYQGALRDLDLSMNELPAEPEAYYARAMSRYSLEDLDGSCDDLHAATRTGTGLSAEQGSMLRDMVQRYCDSSRANFYYQRGIAQYNLRNYRGAVEWHRRGLAKFPGRLLIHDFLANSYFAEGRLDSAVHHYRLAVGSRAAYEQQLVEDGFALSAAREQYPPFTAEIHYHLAQLQLKRSELDAALESVSAALELLKGIRSDMKKNLYQLRGCIYIERNEPDAAIRDFTDCIAMDEADALSYMGRATAWLEKAAGERVTVLAARADAKDPFAAPAWLPESGAFALRKDKDFGSALADCEAVLSMNPDFVYALLLKAAVLSSQGKPHCRELQQARHGGVSIPAMLMQDCGRERGRPVPALRFGISR